LPEELKPQKSLNKPQHATGINLLVKKWPLFITSEEKGENGKKENLDRNGLTENKSQTHETLELSVISVLYKNRVRQ